MTKDQIILNIENSYACYVVLKKNSVRTGVLAPLEGERKYFLNMYARLIVAGMTDKEKLYYDKIARKVLDNRL